MQQLNLPPYPFKLRPNGSEYDIWDDVRKRWLVCTPEEWVRQHFIKHLQKDHGYPESLFQVEKGFTNHRKQNRTDIVVYNKRGQAHVLVECKAPKVKLTPDTLAQALRYHAKLSVNFIFLTNGIEHICAQIDKEKGALAYLPEVPKWTSIVDL